MQSQNTDISQIDVEEIPYGNKKKGISKEKMKEICYGYLFILPIILGMLFFSLGPIFFSLGISFAEYDNFNPPKWIGFDNYLRMFNDPTFYNSLWITLKFAFLSVSIGMFLSFFIALMLSKDIKGVGLFRTIFYAPVIIPGVAATFVFIKMFSTQNGYINNFLNLMGFENFAFFSSPKTAMTSLIIFSLWGAGSSMLIWLSGFKNVPTSLYEAVDIDGGNAFVKFWHITIPMVTPLIFYNLILGIIGGLQCFTQVYLITGGQNTGPGDSLNFLVYKIYRDGMQPPFEMGFASAQAWILFIVIFILTCIVFKSNGWVYYGDE